MIKLLIVEDSPVQREILTHIFSRDPNIQIIGIAKNGEEAIKAATSLKPDVITMDLHMPKLDGLEATRQIMTIQPTPIVIVSSSAQHNEQINAFRALEAGAVAVADKPPGINHPNHLRLQENLINTVKVMSEIKMVRRWSKTKPISTKKSLEKEIHPAEIKLIAIGVSTGGPLVLRDILSGLPKEFPPILIVQHITSGFLNGMVDWLGDTTKQSIHIAENMLLPKPSCIYFAPDDQHMGINQDGYILLSKNPPENGLRPSVSFLFRSVANTIKERALGILLTGMGKDGAQELKLMKQQGAITFAQNKETSLVYGMPGEAAAINAATYLLSPSEIANMIVNLTQGKNHDGNS